MCPRSFPAFSRTHALPLQLLPALEIVAMHDANVKKLFDMLSSPSVPVGIFPVQTQVPLFLSVSAQVTFQAFSRDPIPVDEFNVPASFKVVREQS